MGRLTAEPELRTTQSGINVCKITVAVKREFKNNETDFFDVIAWRKTAEFISRYFTKGKIILVKGRLQQRKYVTKEGENRYVIEIVADTVHFAGDKDKQANYNPASGSVDVYVDDFQEVEIDDDELPF